MNLAAAFVALVPEGVVIVTSTSPAAWAGEVAVTLVSDPKVKSASASPNRTEMTPVRLVPVMVTVVPPATGPTVGSRPVMVGAGIGSAS